MTPPYGPVLCFQVELTKVKSLIHLNIAWNTLGHCGCGPDVDGKLGCRGSCRFQPLQH